MRQTEIDFLDVEEKVEYIETINKVLGKCYEEEKMQEKNLYINVMLTNSKNIKKLNKEYRNIDKETDVLSFPMFEREEIPKVNNTIIEVLGDIVISLEQVEKQAKEYKHSFERELSYMIVHSFYHLLGYDHFNEKDKEEMRKKEEKILTDLQILRI